MNSPTSKERRYELVGLTHEQARKIIDEQWSGFIANGHAFIDDGLVLRPAGCRCAQCLPIEPTAPASKNILASDQVNRYIRALEEPAAAFKYCHPDTISDLTLALGELLELREDVSRYENGRVILTGQIDDLTNDIAALMDTVARLQQERDDLQQFHDWAEPQITDLNRAAPEPREQPSSNHEATRYDDKRDMASVIAHLRYGDSDGQDHDDAADKIERLQQDNARFINSHEVLRIENDALKMAGRYNVETVANQTQRIDFLERTIESVADGLAGVRNASDEDAVDVLRAALDGRITQPPNALLSERATDEAVVLINRYQQVLGECLCDEEEKTHGECNYCRARAWLDFVRTAVTKFDPFANAPLTGPGSRLQADLDSWDANGTPVEKPDACDIKGCTLPNGHTGFCNCLSGETPAAPECRCDAAFEWHCSKAPHMRACPCACHKRTAPSERGSKP